MVVSYSTFAIMLLALNYIWPTLYSLSGIRLKERGILGVVCDALGSHVTPTLFALAVFGVIGAVAPVDWFGFALMITLWAAVLGIKGIVHHQIIDRDNDIRSGTATFVAALSTNTIIRFLTWFNLCIEVPVNLALAFVVYRWCPLAAAGLAAYCVLEVAKFGLGFRFPLGKDLGASRDSIPFANEQFYVSVVAACGCRPTGGTQSGMGMAAVAARSDVLSAVSFADTGAWDDHSSWYTAAAASCSRSPEMTGIQDLQQRRLTS